MLVKSIDAGAAAGDWVWLAMKAPANGDAVNLFQVTFRKWRAGAGGGKAIVGGAWGAPHIGSLHLLAQEAAAERRHLQMLRERITILRRDVRKLVAAAIEEGAKGDWLAIEAELVTELFDLKRKKTIEDLQKVAERLADLHARALNMLELRAKNKKSAANASEIRDHIQNSTTESSNDSEPALSTGRAAAICPMEPLLETKSATAAEIPTADARKPLPLSAVTRACPDIRAYGPGGAVENWRELMAAAVVVRATLGVSPSAYQEACEVMGPESAATAMSCILERAGQINNAGGYLRDLTRKAATGRFSPGPMLMALMRAHTGERRST